MYTGMRDSAGRRGWGEGKGRIVGLAGETGGEGDVEELSKDIVETEGLEDESKVAGWRALEVWVSVRVR
jgi:hypothetical protein